MLNKRIKTIFKIRTNIGILRFYGVDGNTKINLEKKFNGDFQSVNNEIFISYLILYSCKLKDSPLKEEQLSKITVKELELFADKYLKHSIYYSSLYKVYKSILTRDISPISKVVQIFSEEYNSLKVMIEKQIPNLITRIEFGKSLNSKMPKPEEYSVILNPNVYETEILIAETNNLLRNQNTENIKQNKINNPILILNTILIVISLIVAILK